MGVGLGLAVNGGDGDGIWHLRFRSTAAGMEWLGALRTEGSLKDTGGDPRGDLEVELLREDGTVSASVATRDPRHLRLEYESTPGGWLRTLESIQDEAEWEVRLPDVPGAHRVAVHRSLPASDEGWAEWKMGRRELLGEFNLPVDRNEASRGLNLATLPSGDIRSFTLLTNGPSARRLNIVFLSEGYRTNEAAAFTNLAGKVLEKFLEHPPFSAYRRHVNARAAFVPSAESGSDHPSRKNEASSNFRVFDIVDLDSLASKLRAKTRGIDVWLESRLSAAARGALAAYDGPSGQGADALESAIVDDLNRILPLPLSQVYDPIRFQGVTLRSETVVLLGRNPSGSELQRLNRYLMEDAFPTEISKNRFDRDTYFRSTYDSSGISYLVTLGEGGQTRALSVARTVEPEYDVLVMLVNDPDYGGSGGPILVTSAHADSPLIAIHELGHTFAGLADEYETPYPGYPIRDEPNTTQETVRERIKWRSWILPSTPVPTPGVSENASLVGLFEGARYQSKGWYRPKFNCLMRTLGTPFCEVCLEAMTLKLYRLVRPVESVVPGTNAPVALPWDGSVRLTVNALEPSEGALSYEWRINGGPVLPQGAGSLEVGAANLLVGTNRVSARVIDPTPWVRNDASGWMRQDVEWRVTMAPAPAPAPPTMRVARGGADQLLLAWPATSGDWVLEMTDGLGGGAWFRILESSTVEGSERVVRLPFPGDVAFFRLRRP